MAWIESHQTLGHHPKTLRLASMLRVRLPEAVGYLHFLWWWALDYAPDGLLPASDIGVVSRACAWRARPERFFDGLLAAGFVEQAELEGVYRIHDWMDYAGKLSEQRKLRRESNRAAQSAHRQRLRQQSVSADVIADADDSKQPTGHNPTGPDLNAAADAASSRTRTRGDGGFQPLGGFLPKRRRTAAAAAASTDLPDEVRARLQQPPIGSTHADH